MNDIESARARASANPLISSVAQSKLDSLGKRGLAAQPGEGLVDAFAEVFANMNVSSPPPVAEVNPQPSPSGDGRDADQGNDDDVVADEAVDHEQTERPLVVGEAAAVPVPQDIPPATADGSARPETQTQDDIDQSPTETPVAEAVSSTPVQTAVPVAVDASQFEQIGQAQALVNGRKSTKDAAQADAPEQALTGTVKDALAAGDDGLANAETGNVNPEQDAATESADAAAWGGDPDDSKRDRRRGQRESGTQPVPGGQAVRTPPVGGSRDGIDVSEMMATSNMADGGNAVAEPQATEKLLQSVREQTAGVTMPTAGVATATKNGAALSRSLGSEIGGVSRTAAMSLEPPAGTRPAADAKPASKSAEPGSSPADILTRIKLVQRVSKAFQHLGPDGGVVRLRLAPAEMGTVRVEMRIQQKRVDARVVADSEAAGAALREHLPDLRARLEAYGMQVESIEVETEVHSGNDDPSSGQAFQDTGRDPSWGRRRDGDLGSGTLDSRRSSSRQNESPVATAVTSFISRSGVDVQW